MKSVILSVLVALTWVATSAQDFLSTITPEKMKQMMPGGGDRVNQMYPQLMEAMKQGGINTPNRVSAFLAQVGHESGSFRYMQELASGKAYEGRRDLGNTQPGDGVRFKGRGPIQITGRSNYEQVSKALGHDFIKHPEDLAKPEWGFKAATWFWNKNKLNDLADKKEFDKITKRVNGGYNGKADRDSRYNTINKVLGGQSVPTKPSNPTKPTNPTKPSNPTKPTKPTNPTRPNQPIKPTKPNTPKPNTPKPNTPRPNTPKPNTPRPNTPKPNTPRPNTPKPNTPRPNTPKPNTPRPNTPRPNTPKPNTPRPNTPKPNTPRPNTPKPSTPRPSAPRPSAPRPSAPRPSMPRRN